MARKKVRGVLEIATCIPPAGLVRALRELVQEAAWKFERNEGSRMVDRFAIIMPLTTSVRSIGVNILTGPYKGLQFTAWSHVEGSSGAIHKVEWRVPKQMDPRDFHFIIKHWVAKLPRAPWKWTFRERSRLGYLLPTYRRSKRSFTSLGIPTNKGDWPESGKELGNWPPEEIHTKPTFFEEE